MSEWTEVTIGDIAEIFDGPHATPTKTNDGPWFLSISSLDRGRLKLEESAHLSEEDFQKWTRRVTPRAGDVLFSYETRLGEAALMPAGIRACLGRRMALLRPKQNKIDSRFLLYAYISPDFQKVIRQRSIPGATVDRILLSELPTWPLTIPNLSEQRIIAELLASMDDKIAANKKTVEAYESLNQAWFEDLKVDTEQFGDETIPLSTLIEFNPTTPLRRSETATYVDMSALPTHGARVQAWTRRAPKSGARFRNGDTLMARITPCLENGKTGFVDFLDEDEVGTGSTEFIVLRARPGVPVHVPYFLARSPRFRKYAIQNMVGSTGRQRVAAAQLAKFVISRPVTAELDAFGKHATKAFTHMKAIDRESHILQRLRDLLLPKLMSGEIRVREAEEMVESGGV